MQAIEGRSTTPRFADPSPDRPRFQIRVPQCSFVVKNASRPHRCRGIPGRKSSQCIRQSAGSHMPSRCDSAKALWLVTSDWHPRLLHGVALRLKGRGAERYDRIAKQCHAKASDASPRNPSAGNVRVAKQRQVFPTAPKRQLSLPTRARARTPNPAPAILIRGLKSPEQSVTKKSHPNSRKPISD